MARSMAGAGHLLLLPHNATFAPWCVKTSTPLGCIGWKWTPTSDALMAFLRDCGMRWMHGSISFVTIRDCIVRVCADLYGFLRVETFAFAAVTCYI